MTLQEFLKNGINPNELYILRVNGYVVASFWIDKNQPFAVAPEYANRQFTITKSELTLKTLGGLDAKVRAHYLDMHI